MQAFTFRPVGSILLIPLVISVSSVWAADPVIIYPSADIGIRSSRTGPAHAKEGRKTDPRLCFKQDNGEAFRILFRFEFSGNAAKPCVAAILKIRTVMCYPDKENRRRIQAHALLRPFTERWASWGHCDQHDKWINPGGDFHPQAYGGRNLTSEDKDRKKGGKVIDFDITPLVQGWQTKRTPNYGLVLALEKGSKTYAHFHSKESKAAMKPTLELYYTTRPSRNPQWVKASAIKPLGTMPRIRPKIATLSLNRGRINEKYEMRVIVTGGIPPYTWKATGLPQGVELSTDGLLQGKPTETGNFRLSLIATDAQRRMARAALSFEVAAKAGSKDGKDLVAVKSEKKRDPVEDDEDEE